MGMRSYSFDLLNLGLGALGRPYLTFKARARLEDRESLAGLKMLELGAQVVRETNDTSAKVFLSEYGAMHVSIDLNGEFGALPIDLSADDTISNIEKATGIRTFDITTNYGTTEHIYPLTAQYPTFRNVHDLCSVGGVILHEVPMTGYWRGHSPAHYSSEFFERLAELCGYRLIHWSIYGPDPTRMNVGCVLQKTKHPFCSRDDFPVKLIHWEEGGRFGKFHEQKKRKQK